MELRRKIHERVYGVRMQNQDVWYLTKGTDGEAIVLYERSVRHKGDREYRLVEERRMNLREAMNQGGELARKLWYAMPD